MPYVPVNDAGIRMEPPPSVPSASAQNRAESAAEEPPDDPPGVLRLFHGLRVMPVSGESVEPFQPNSGVVVFPMKTAPASRNRATVGASSFQGPVASTVSDPRRVGHPFVRRRSLIATGTPSSGESGSPSSQRFSDSSACRSESAASIWQNELISASRASIRARHASATSTGDNSLSEYAADSSAAPSSCGSLGTPQFTFVIPSAPLSISLRVVPSVSKIVIEQLSGAKTTTRSSFRT
jgi:hypothetical protein